MKYRKFGRTGWEISEISFGAWAIGGAWGTVDDTESLRALHTAIDNGVNFIDTADVYGDGRSERLIAQVRKERPETIYVATKIGRRLPAQTPEGYTPENMEGFINRNLQMLDTETIDLLQLHCPPMQVYYMPEVFDFLDDMVKAGKVQYYGVSVEKVEEGLKAMEYPNLQSVQIIFNIFRQRPAELFFDVAKQREVGILARVPLSSGLLTGKITKDSTFPEDDHRNFNREGAAFDVGETFSGLQDFDAALQAVEELRELVPEGVSIAQFALKWILMHDAVSAAIPGAKNPDQATSNTDTSDLPDLSDETMAKIRDIYEQYARPQVHQRW